MAKCPHKYGVDVYMDDRGYYRAECADCDWKWGPSHSEVMAEDAAKGHDPSWTPATSNTDDRKETP